MLVWENSMEVGVRSIDAEHKHLIDFISLVQKASESQRGKFVNNKMIFVIRELFQKHFLHEEDLMFGIKYPRVNQHMIEHSTMLTTYDMIAVDLQQSGDPSTAIDFITTWITNHFKTEDANLALFIRGLKQAKAQKAIPKKSASSFAASGR